MSGLLFNYENDSVFVKVFFSIAGLATQIIAVNKKCDSTAILIDIGDGSTRDILASRNEVDFSNINTVAITHGHYDHMGGLYSFLGIKRMLGFQGIITIIYPENCIEVINIIQAFTSSYPDTIPYTIKEIPLTVESKSEINLDCFMLESYPVSHRGSTLKLGATDPIPALGYKIIIKKAGFIFSYSGDTSPNEGLYDLFTPDVDIGFIEATHPDDSWISDKINRYHLTEAEANEYSKNCKKSVIIHSLPEHIRKK